MKRKKKLAPRQLSEKQKLAQIRNSNKGRICFMQGTIQYLLTSSAVGLTEKEQELLKIMSLSCKELLTNWK
jgi:hypothetical protein